MNNLRLEQCPNCLGFADPYVEHDALTLLLDLILLKREVYRHLLFNRGSEPRHMRQTGAEDTKGTLLQWPSRSKDTWSLVVKLGLSVILVDAVIRWRDSKDIPDSNRVFSQVLVACFLDTLLFHLGVTLASALLLKSMNWFRTTFNRPYSPKLGTRTEFRIPLVSLTLFYSSLTKLLLLLLLAIWQSPISSPAVNSVESGTGLPNYIAEHEHTRSALALLDESQFDRAWVIRNVLGVVLFGWCSKSLIAQCIDYWAGTNVTFEYSIP